MKMFLRHCRGCGTHRGLTGELCPACADELASLGKPLVADLEGFTCVTLAEYSGMFRRLILRAKVKGDHAALAWLEDWAGAALAKLWRPRREACVMACPSSLWGRLRGRLDVAGNVAAAVAGARRLPLVPAPYHLHWRAQKRALAANLADRAHLGSALPERWNHWLAARWQAGCGARLGGQLLLLDDVATSGRTLAETARAVSELSGGVRPYLVALAGAPRLRAGG